MATTTLRMSKHHGLGNDFLVALEAENPGLRPDAVLARRLCQRHHGIGADGMMFGLVGDARGIDLRMVLFNADGSEAAISGNGIRCLAQAALRRTGRRDGAILIDTAAGLRSLTSVPTGDDATDLLRVEMGAVTDGPSLTSDAETYPARRRTILEIGNPHLILLVDSLEGVDPAVDGPALEAGFPDGINVHFMTSEGPDVVRLLHWERGAGVTEACGSGATVAAVAAHRWGLVGDRVTVRMPGGEAVVDIGETVALSGPAVLVASIEVHT